MIINMLETCLHIYAATWWYSALLGKCSPPRVANGLLMFELRVLALVKCSITCAFYSRIIWIYCHGKPYESYCRWQRIRSVDQKSIEQALFLWNLYEAFDSHYKVGNQSIQIGSELLIAWAGCGCYVVSTKPRQSLVRVVWGGFCAFS